MKKIIKSGILVIIIAFSFTILYQSNVTFASSDLKGSGGGAPIGSGGSARETALTKLDNPINANNVQELLYTIVDLAIFLGSIIAVLMFIWVGFTFVMARGNETEIKKAKEWFMYAVIGTAILISSKVIVEVIKTTLIKSGVVDEKVFTLPK